MTHNENHLVHFILQAKGGVGKSLVASLLAQYLQAKNKEALCIDADPLNASFSTVTGLKAIHFPIITDGQINSRLYDELIEKIYHSECDTIIDSGASSFVALSHYLISNEIAEILNDRNKILVVHMILAGGVAHADTIVGLGTALETFSEKVKFVIWKNPFWGKVDFENLKIFTENQTRIIAVINLPNLPPETFGQDFAAMQADKITFRKALEDQKRPLMVKQRLKQIRNKIFTALDALNSQGGV